MNNISLHREKNYLSDGIYYNILPALEQLQFRTTQIKAQPPVSIIKSVGQYPGTKCFHQMSNNWDNRNRMPVN